MAAMSTCPSCQHPATKRDGHDAAGRQRYHCRPCRVCEIPRCSVHLAFMSTCPSCQQPATKRDGFDAANPQRFHSRPCHRDFTAHSTSAFSGYRWPPDVIVMAVRWYCSLPLSAAQVVRLLAERHLDVSRHDQPFVEHTVEDIHETGVASVRSCQIGRHAARCEV